MVEAVVQRTKEADNKCMSSCSMYCTYLSCIAALGMPNIQGFAVISRKIDTVRLRLLRSNAMLFAIRYWSAASTTAREDLAPPRLRLRLRMPRKDVAPLQTTPSGNLISYSRRHYTHHVALNRLFRPHHRAGSIACCA